MAKEHTEPNAELTGVLRFINDVCLIDAVCIVLFLSLYSKIPKIKKRSAVRSALDIKPDVGQALPSSAIR